MDWVPAFAGMTVWGGNDGVWAGFGMPDSPDEVGGHSHVEGSVFSAGEDIDAWRFHFSLGSCFRRNDGLGRVLGLGWVPAFAGMTVWGGREC